MNTNFINFEETEHLPLAHCHGGNPIIIEISTTPFWYLHVLEFRRLQKKEDGSFSAR